MCTNKEYCYENIISYSFLLQKKALLLAQGLAQDPGNSANLLDEGDEDLLF